ncbi:MAG TPA: transcription termination factor NusA [Bacteroidetes bacterium]|nr:transcription termination factor NusA [Bacteroidota bacterium]
MAKLRKKQPINKQEIIEAFTEMAKVKGIDKDLLQGIIEDTFSLLIKKKYGNQANFEIIVNMERGDVEIYLTKTVVEEVLDPETEISLEEANQSPDEQYEVGDDYAIAITLDSISESFGRRLITLATQSLTQRIKEIEKNNISNEYAAKVGEVVIGEIYQIRKNDLLIMHNKIEMHMPREEQIPSESTRYRKNQAIKAVIKAVRKNGPSGLPEIVLSRSNEKFLERLFEIEIPEIYDGLIQIKAIARDPGRRSKVAVQSSDERVDPVGACVGMKGVRIHSIVRELSNENIDLIEYSEDPVIFIQRAMQPARVKEIQVFPAARSANIIVSEDQVPLAIGINGQNIRLASQLTGYSLTLIKEGIEDIDITEFKEEFGESLINKLLENNVKSAREFLDTDSGKLLEIEGLNKENIKELRSIILSEFDEEEDPEYIENLESKIE